MKELIKFGIVIPAVIALIFSPMLSISAAWKVDISLFSKIVITWACLSTYVLLGMSIAKNRKGKKWKKR
jgi:hypothetical protein